MSLLQYQTQANKDKFFFLLAEASTITANNILAKNISTLTLDSGKAKITDLSGINVQSLNVSTFYLDAQTISSFDVETDFASISSLVCLNGNISSITTNNITLDGNTIDTGGLGFGAVLLLNGLPIATGTSSLSSIQDWSYFPALSTLQMGSNNINNAGNITCQNIYNALNVQTDTLTALTSYTAPSGVVTNLRTTNLSSVNFVTSNIVTGNLVASQISSFQTVGQTGVFGGVSSLTVSSGTVGGGVGLFRGLSSLTLSTGTINGTPFISGSNWSQYPATQTVNLANNTLNNTSNITGTVVSVTATGGNVGLTASNDINLAATDVNVTVDGGLNIADIANINLTAQNGNRGAINLTANSGFNNGVAGQIFLTANGGQVGGVGTGGTIELTANTPIGFSNLTSKISLSASGINSYAGVIPPLASAFGYNFIYGTNGVYIAAGLPPGLPNVPGTTYIYGTLGIEMPSDAYMTNIYPYWNGLATPPDLTINGRFIIPNLAQVCVRMSNVRQIDFQSNVATYMSNLDTLAMSGNGSITTSNLVTTVGTANTFNATTLNVITVAGVTGSAQITNMSNIGTNNINTNFINGLPVGSFVNTIVSTFQTASISSATISSINGVGLSNLINQTVSTFQTASISSATISTINNFASFGTKSMRVQGDVAQIQLSNTLGQAGSLNLLMRQNFAEIQAFNSSFTVPLNLKLTADNFGFNVDPSQITGGYEMDISGNTQVRWGSLKVTNNPSEAGLVINKDNINISTIRQPVIQWGNIATNGNNGNVLTVLSSPYINSNYVVQMTHSDNNAGANISYVISSRSTFTSYWTNAGGGNHTTSFVTFGDLS